MNRGGIKQISPYVAGNTRIYKPGEAMSVSLRFYLLENSNAHCYDQIFGVYAINEL